MSFKRFIQLEERIKQSSLFLSRNGSFSRCSDLTQLSRAEILRIRRKQTSSALDTIGDESYIISLNLRQFQTLKGMQEALGNGFSVTIKPELYY